MSFNQRFALFVPQAIKSLRELSNLVFVFLYTVLTTLFVPIVLLLIIVVEIPRIELGILLFDPSQDHARLAAILVIMAFLVTSTIVFLVEKQYGEVKKSEKWSLRVFIRNITYRAGLRPVEEKGFSKLFRGAAFFSKITTLVLSIMGTMQPQIVAQGDLPWWQGIQNVLLNSNAQEFAVWISSAVFTYFLILNTSVITYFVAWNAINYMDTLEGRATEINKKNFLESLLTPEEFLNKIKKNKRRFSSIIYLPEDKFEIQGKRARFYLSDEDKFTEFYTSSELDSLIEEIKLKRKSNEKDVESDAEVLPV